MRHESVTDQETLELDCRTELLRALWSVAPIEAGLIFTYSADVAPLYAVLLTLVGAKAVTNAEEAAAADPVVHLRSIQALQDKLRIFVHSGGFRIPHGTTEKMSGLLDQLIWEFIPREGEDVDRKVSFHPKMYLIKYAATEIASPEIR